MKQKNIGTCKFCKNEKQLIKAHIIPRRFYIGVHNDKYLNINSKTGEYEISQCGSYDKNILCAECDDNIIGEFDKEGYKVLFSDFLKHKSLQIWSNYKIYQINNNDYDLSKLRKFFVSILWRASISEMKEWMNIKLGPYEKKAYEILKGTNEHIDLFKILIYKSSCQNELNQLVLMTKIKDRMCKTYIIHIAGFLIKIIVDPKRLTKAFKNKFENYFLSENNAYIIETSDVTKNVRANFEREMHQLYESGFRPPMPPEI